MSKVKYLLLSGGLNILLHNCACNVTVYTVTLKYLFCFSYFLLVSLSTGGSQVTTFYSYPAGESQTKFTVTLTLHQLIDCGTGNTTTAASYRLSAGLLNVFSFSLFFFFILHETAFSLTLTQRPDNICF